MPIRYLRSVLAVALATVACSLVLAQRASAADGTMTWGVHVSLTPAFFDPADATGTALPLMVYYGVHDALVRPMAKGGSVGLNELRHFFAHGDWLRRRARQ